MDRKAAGLFLAIALAVIAYLGYTYWPRPPEPAPVASAPPEPAAAPSAPVAAAEPAVQYPIEAASTPASGPVFSDDMPKSLVELLGREAVAAYLQSDDFARRFVATVDNLGREHATPRLWPVNPAAGRFTVQGSGDAVAIAAANSRRYDAFVRWVQGLDSARLVAWYLHQYPRLQAAYAELGYPKRAFNDRLVEVIDLLLATPEPTGPIGVRLTEVKGPVKSTRPWVHYEYADSTLEERPSGPRILLRIGPDHARTLKAKLREIRRLVAPKRP